MKKRNEFFKRNGSAKKKNGVKAKNVKLQVDTEDKEALLMETPEEWYLDKEETTKLEADFCDMYLENSDKEIVENEKLLNTVEELKMHLLKKRKNVIWIGGYSETGRRTVIQYLANFVGNNVDVPKALQNIAFIQVNFDNAYENYGNITEYLNTIIDKYIKKGVRKIVFFCGELSKAPIDFKECYFSIKSELDKKNLDMLKFIFLVTEKNEEFELENEREFEIIKDSYLIKHEALRDFSEIVRTLRPRINELQEEHGATVSDRVMEEAILIKASKVTEPIMSFYCVLSLCDSLLGVVELYNKTGDCNIATRYHLQKLFRRDFAYFDSMLKAQKRKIAYHEVGHTLLVLLDNENTKFFNGVKIIMDADMNSGGMTYYWEKAINLSNPDRDWIIKTIAIDLAGRVCEADDNKGADCDLEEANNLAREFILYSGLSSLGRNYTILEDDKFISERNLEKVENDILLLLQKSEEYAKECIKKYSDFVDELAELLIKDGIVTKKVVKELWKKYN